MSKKRPSSESNADEQTNEDSESAFQQDENAKRVKVSSVFDTTLQDLPIEIVELILVKAVVMEVKDMKLVRSVWKEKADLVINRLGAVSPQWSNILTTDFFANELNRTLDQTAQKTIRMEILHQLSSLEFYVLGMATLKDEIFCLCLLREPSSDAVHVHDRNDVAEVRAVIPLPGTCPIRIAACSISSCIYILSSELSFRTSVLRITRDDQQQFKVSPMISEMKTTWDCPNLSVTANGSLILSGCLRGERRFVLSVYDASGSLQHEIRMLSSSPSLLTVIPNTSGNLVLVSIYDQQNTKFTEINMDGTFLRERRLPFRAFNVCRADSYGRLLISERITLLDSEFNLLDFTCAQLYEGVHRFPRRLHYNSQRDEILTTVGGDLAIFHFTEE